MFDKNFDSKEEASDNFYYDLKAISEILIELSINDGSSDKIIFLAECLEKCVNDYRKMRETLRTKEELQKSFVNAQ